MARKKGIKQSVYLKKKIAWVGCLHIDANLMRTRQHVTRALSKDLIIFLAMTRFISNFYYNAEVVMGFVLLRYGTIISKYICQ